MEAFQQANSLMVDELYEEALSLYNKAVESIPENAEFYVKRAACHLKLNNFEKVVEDCNIVLSSDRKDLSAVTLLRKGIALFELEEYESAKRALASGREASAGAPLFPQFDRWTKKVDSAIKEDEDEDGERSVSSQQDENTGETKETSNPNEIGEEGSAVAEVQTPQPTLVTRPKYRQEWYQSQGSVTVSLFAKDIGDSQVYADVIDGNKLKIAIVPPDGGKDGYEKEFELFEDVQNSCKQDHGRRKFEVTMSKLDSSIAWDSLEKASAVAKRRWDDSSNVNKAEYPSSSKKKVNWESLTKDEEEEKLEGDAALNKVFRDIYANASEEQRRAMNKSFMESGGTVLSTNWQDVGKREVEGTPPEGLEMRKWSE